MRTHTRLNALATAIDIVPVLAAPALAQGATGGDFGEYIGTVTLSESRRGIQAEIAPSLTVLALAELGACQASTVAEYLDSVPGGSLANGSSAQTSAVNIRGFGSVAGTCGTDSKVSVLIDGVA